MAGLSGAAPGSCVLEVSNITNIALAFGFAIFVLVYATAAYTGQPCSTPITITSLKLPAAAVALTCSEALNISCGWSLPM